MCSFEDKVIQQLDNIGQLLCAKCDADAGHNELFQVVVKNLLDLQKAQLQELDLIRKQLESLNNKLSNNGN